MEICMPSVFVHHLYYIYIIPSQSSGIIVTSDIKITSGTYCVVVIVFYDTKVSK